jgi:hypothetical protein
MPLFGLLNYEDYILGLIARSDQTHNGLMVFIICTITSIIRFHLSALIYWLVLRNSLIDYVSPIIITVVLSWFSDRLYRYVDTHRPFFEYWVDYFIINYNTNNFIRWKRKLMFSLLCYILVISLLFTIDNELIIITVIQTFISFVICDLIDNNVTRKIYDRVHDHFYPPFEITIYPSFEKPAEPKVDSLKFHTVGYPLVDDYGQKSEDIFDDSQLTMDESLDTDLDKELKSIVEDLRVARESKIIRKSEEVPNLIPKRVRPVVRTIYEPTDVKAYLEDYISPVQDFFGNVRESIINVVNEIPVKPRTPPRVTKGSRF